MNKRETFGVLALLFIFLSILFPYIPGHESDANCWRGWSWVINTSGLRNAYDSGTNYLPFYQYIMWIYGKLVGNPEHIGLRIGYLRCFTLAFDLWGLWFVYRWIDKRTSLLLLTLVNILNISYAYNTVIWGQVDGIMATLILISLYYGWKNKTVLSTIFFVLAVNMKLQSVIMLPLWGLLCLHGLMHQQFLKGTAKLIVAGILTQAIILFPFSLATGGLAKIWAVVTTSLDYYPRVSMNAFNFWHLILPNNPWDINDQDQFFAGLSYKTFGLILFCISSALALWPIARTVFKKFRDREVAISRELVWLSGSLIALLFFYFNSQMHERYCHPAFILIAAYSFYTKNWKPYLLFSIAYFLNLEKVLRFLQLPNYETVIFHPRFVGGLFLLCIIYLFVLLYKRQRYTQTLMKDVQVV